MTERETLKLALEALHGFIPYLPLNDEAQCGHYDKAITAIKESLAQLEQEPVAYQDTAEKCRLETVPANGTLFHTTPPQRTWVGLTEKDILEAAVKSQEGISPRNDTLRFAVAIEAKLKEKNT